MKKDGGTAFPYTNCEDHGISGGYGMSLRDYFAAKAPAEYLAVITEQIQKAGDNDTPVANIMAAAAYMYADAMLAERVKE
jgi:hypothetical protein